MSFYKDVYKAREVLAAVHPDLFDRENPVPLKIGITDDLAARYHDMPHGVCRAVIHLWTKRRAYLKACASGAIRRGLDGPSGEVTELQSKWAASAFRKRQAAEDAKKAAKTPKAAE